jgi:hypothetical protein
MRAIIALAFLASPALSQSREEVAFVRDVFAQVQLLSFRKGVEVCGFVGYDRDGELAISGPEIGEYASCSMDWPANLTVIASYHTHGLFDADYINELPSDIDMLSDQSLGVNGWIATPGGRLWYVDSERMVTKQVCTLGCLPMAPGFLKTHGGLIAKGYRFDELVARLAQ